MYDLELEDHWRRLGSAEKLRKGSSGHLLNRVAPTGRWDFWLAVIQPGGIRALLMGLRSASIPEPEQLPASRGFVAQATLTVPPGLETQAVIEIRLVNPAFRDVFDVLIANLVEAGDQQTDEAAARDAVLDQLRRWQRFVEKVPPDGLSDEARRGLYGELYLLREYLSPAIGHTGAVEAWTGPTGAYHDFQAFGLGVEVKTTTTKEPQTVRISSERQLDPDGLDLLVLSQLSLDEKPGAGETLPAIVSSLRQQAAEAACEAEFESRLYEAGYHDVHSSRYDKSGYLIRQIHVWEVRGGFPRIVESDLRSGVGNVIYSIAVAECSPYAIPVSDLVNRLKEASNA